MNQKKKYRELIQQKSADKEKSWGRYPSATVMIPLFNISCLHLHKKKKYMGLRFKGTPKGKIVTEA